MPSILVVDDSPIMRKNLKAILTKSGYTVAAEATNGLEAYHAYEEHRPDLVTMDITMPVMDGIQATKKITAAFPDARIVVISAFDQRTMLFEAMENGAKHYIIKPITADKLLNVLSTVLGAGTSTEAKIEAAPASEQAAEAESTPNLSIENQNGRFVINLTQQLTHRHLDALQQAVQGLLFIKPLNVVLQVGTEQPQEEIIARIAEIIATIQQAGGVVAMQAENRTLQAHSKFRALDVEFITV